MKMTIDLKEMQIKPKQYERCNRTKNFKPLTEMAKDMAIAEDETEIYKIASSIYRYAKKKKRAEKNEYYIDTIKDIIINNTKKGDTMTPSNICSYLYTVATGADEKVHSMTYINSALNDLVNDGYLKREIMTHLTRGYNYSSITVYTVI